MYETYLQNEREFDEWVGDGAEKDKDGLTWTRGRFAVEQLKSHNRLSLIKVMKALEKELEGEKKEILELETGLYTPKDETISLSGAYGYNQALQLSLDKIREFITKLEKEV